MPRADLTAPNRVLKLSSFQHTAKEKTCREGIPRAIGVLHWQVKLNSRELFDAAGRGDRAAIGVQLSEDHPSGLMDR